MDLGLKNKVAMVAGSSKGLGFAVAKFLAAEGAKVSMASSNKDAIDRAAAQISQNTGAEVMPFHADLRTESAITSWRDAAVERFGGIDLLFANSGGPPAGGFMSFSDAAWKDAFELLVMSSIRMARAVIPSMQSRGGGSIVFSTSGAVKEPIPNLTLSNVLRGSVSALAKTLSHELASDRIRVNQAIPGRIATDRLVQLDTINAQRQNISVTEQKEKMIATIPLGRYGEPDEFARGVVFLLSAAASYITGATLQIDGGMLRGQL